MSDNIETAKIVETFNQGFNVLVDLIGEMEGRIGALENRPEPTAITTPEQRAVSQAKKASKKYIPREGSQAAAILAAIIDKGGVWSPSRGLDALEAAGLYPTGDRPESTVSVILCKLMEEGYLRRIANGRYSVVPQ